jgi:putative hydrolases of HD superfamily
MDLWLEYEEGTSLEAKWVRQVDKFECLLQAYEYEQRTYGEKDLGEFQNLSEKISSPELTIWLKLLQKERAAYLSKRKHRLPVIFLLGMSDSQLPLILVDAD